MKSINDITQRKYKQTFLIKIIKNHIEVEGEESSFLRILDNCPVWGYQLKGVVYLFEEWIQKRSHRSYSSWLWLWDISLPSSYWPLLPDVFKSQNNSDKKKQSCDTYLLLVLNVQSWHSTEFHKIIFCASSYLQWSINIICSEWNKLALHSLYHYCTHYMDRALS
jgi:hypothetical protein